MRIHFEKKGTSEKAYEEISALKVKRIFEKIRNEDRRRLGFTCSKPTDFLISTLLVPPPQIRTSVELGPEKRAEDNLTHAYRRIIELNNLIKTGVDGYKRSNCVKEIQKLVAAIMMKIDRKYLPAEKGFGSKKKKTVMKIKSIEERLTSK